MSLGKEIRSKIKSVQNTKKITKAMQMVATSKMRKTQDLMRKARPYAENIRRVIANIAHLGAYSRNTTSYLRVPPVIKNIGIILITTDKGLCGGLNVNAFKVFTEKVKAFKDIGVNVEVCALGHKGFSFASRLGINIISSAVSLGDVPKMEKLVGPISGIFNNFYNAKLDAVYVIYSKFVNTMQQKTICEKLLPLTVKDLTVQGDSVNDYLFEPDATFVLEGLIRRYIESVTYQCVADNMASEQVARMIAMKSATDNAENAISELKLVYNKSRQATITKEINEIVSGSAALNN